MRHTYQKLLFPFLAAALIFGCYAYRDHLTGLSTKATSNKASLSKQEDNIIPKNTLSQIQQNLAEREYHISFDSLKNTLQSPNRSHGLRAYYKPGQLTIVNRKDSAGHNFRLELVNEGIYADGKKLFKPIQSAQTEQQGNKLYIHHKGFTEEYINDTSGVRQNFIIETTPEGTRSLEVRLDVKRMKVADGGNNKLTFSDEKNSANTKPLYYRDLKCWDAGQNPLAANLAYINGKVQIEVNVENATYPVTIDPLVVNGNPNNADALLEANKPGAQMGYCVSSAGDIDANGFSDVLVGAPLYDNGQAKEGAVFVYYGSATGLVVNTPQILETNKAGALLGFSVASAGDVNKDGFADIIVGAPLCTNGHYAEGVALVYYGAAGGLPTQPSRLLEIDQAESRMGFSVAGAGDINADGFSDIIVGAYAYDNVQKDKGMTLIYFGSPGGIPAKADWSVEGDQAEGWAGYSVRGAGDVDGDGYGDVLTGAPTYDNGHTNEGIVRVYHGSLTGIDLAKIKTIESNQNGALLGYAVSGAGDINGDGFSDVIIGAPLYTKGQYAEGVAFVHYGGGSGLAVQPALALEANQAESRMGHSVACAGDVDGDGFADVIVGAYLYDNGQKDEGRVYVYQGRENGLNPTPISTIEGEQIDGYVGFNVAPAGDINGDGYSDIIAGSYAYDNGQKDEGAAFVWLGGGEKVISHTVLKWKEYDMWDSELGYSICNAGDINGDGYSDIAVGAKFFDHGQSNEGAIFVYFGSLDGSGLNFPVILEGEQVNAQLGTSVAGAGDVNGDGYGDLVAGAVFYDYNKVDEGAALVYHGKFNGINITPSSVLGSNQSQSGMGYSVSGVGDLNGDGFDDLAIGSPKYRTR